MEIAAWEGGDSGIEKFKRLRARTPPPHVVQAPGTRRSGLHDLLQRRTVTNDERGSLKLEKLSFLKLGKKTADGFARRSNNFSDFLVRKSQLHLQPAVVAVCRLRGPRQQKLGKFLRG